MIGEIIFYLVALVVVYAWIWYSVHKNSYQYMSEGWIERAN